MIKYKMEGNLEVIGLTFKAEKASSKLCCARSSTLCLNDSSEGRFPGSALGHPLPLLCNAACPKPWHPPAVMEPTCSFFNNGLVTTKVSWP